MSYYRPTRVDELTAWLLREDLVVERDDARNLAEALIEEFDIMNEYSTPT